MLKIAIMDDEPDQIEILVNLLSEFFTLESRTSRIKYKYVIHRYTSGDELLKYIETGYNLIFLDYQVPGMSGFETARKIREVDNNVKIFFVTGFEQHWKDGYKVSAYRYILKPIDRDDFFNDVRDALNHLIKSERIIIFRPAGSVVKLPASRFIYAHSDKRMVIVHYLNASGKTETLRISGGIKYLSDELRREHGFVQPHVSYCVNPIHIKSVQKSRDGRDLYIALSNGAKLLVARDRRDEVLSAVINVMGEST